MEDNTSPNFGPQMQNSPSPQLSAPTPAALQPAGHSKKKTIIVSLVILLAVLVVAGGVYAWQHGKLQQQKTESDKKISSLQAELSAAKSSTPSAQTSTTQPAIYSEKMPNGKTISYPLNENNASVLWWYGNEDKNSTQPNGTYLYLSSTKLAHFISSIPTDYLKKACDQSTDGFDSGMIMTYAFTTATKQLEHSHAANCVDVLRLPDLDKTGTYRAEATKVSEEVNVDFQAFAKSVTIK